MPFCLPQILRQTHCKIKKNGKLKKATTLLRQPFLGLLCLFFKLSVFVFKFIDTSGSINKFRFTCVVRV